MRILIVDDEPLFGRALRRMLERDEVVFCGSVAAAVACVASVSPEAILCDALLPDGRGEDFLERVKTDHPAIRCILMSGDFEAHPGPSTDGFLAKPFDASALRQALRGVPPLARRASW